MKISLIIFILLTFVFSKHLVAMTSDTLFISAENLTAGNFYLTSSYQDRQEDILWRYSPGDDSLWANPNYDDNSWELVNTWLDVFKPESKKWKGIGWFRKVV